MKSEHGWIIGGEIYKLPGHIKIRRHVEGQPLKETLFS
jgi:hypothetical protein